MIHKSNLAGAIRKIGKRPSKGALRKIDKILEQRTEEILERAKRKADFAGRKTLLEEDIE